MRCNILHPERSVANPELVRGFEREVDQQFERESQAFERRREGRFLSAVRRHRLGNFRRARQRADHPQTP